MKNQGFIPKRVFLTGANGFLGRAILRVLVAENIPTVCYTRKKFIHKNEYQDVTPIIGELDNIKKIEAALRNCDSIIHCAGLIDFNKTNHDRLHFIHKKALQNLVDASIGKGIKRILYVSSHWTIGFSYSEERVCTEKDLLSPDGKIYNVYQKTKLDGEKFLQYNLESDITYIIVNPTQIWGVSNKNEVFWQLIKKAKSKRLFIVPSGGLNIVHVNDVARGVLLALKFGRPNERYILGGRDITFKSLFSEFLKNRGERGIIIELPNMLIRFMMASLFSILGIVFPKWTMEHYYLKTVPVYKFYSSEKAKSELGYGKSIDTAEIINEYL